MDGGDRDALSCHQLGYGVTRHGLSDRGPGRQILNAFPLSLPLNHRA